MKCFVAIVAAALAATASALPRPDTPAAPAPYKPQQEYSEPASYSYQWGVQDDYSGNNYGQQETRQDQSTSGSYYVLLPDGRTQKVTYSVDGYGGYVAEVTYEGTAQYPEPAPYKPAPAAPAYKEA